ncbi:hypothetical protein LUZ61_009056 [Rhynchospora tenuis]|uniref:NB-ARC domain-containing protein n=1 Tax=Rhynchospora tenuis TaxID=198213 RepID=A0AAD5ZWI5_9POAL|nr:hypothetical protein LUZ61_009056 [Rhynchospora tenuis]
MGGVGKTTLAQMVYKDKNVQSYFNLKVWVCVSDQFDLERLTKEIIQCATGNECNVTNLDLLQETLKELVKSKRVLLVLDDIWSKDWQRLLGPMIDASDGSAVILTTRDPEHIECTVGDMNILKSMSLEGMEGKKYWEFFKSCAGLEVTLKNYGQLEGIAKEICHRLKGSPLAAKTLGVRGSFAINSLGNVLRKEAAEEAELDKQEFVDTLRLDWDSDPRFPISDNEIQRESLPIESFSGFESLEKLCIDDCTELTCPAKMVLPPSIKVLKLGYCGELKDSIPSCLENLSSLEELSIISCPRIVSIPDEVMRNLKSLKSLSVKDCENLISLGDEEFLKSIKDRFIEDCPKLKKTGGRNPDGRQLSDVPSSSNSRKRKARARK